MKDLVCVVDANRQHTDLLSATLRDLYNVKIYDAPGNALAGMNIARPRLILVGQRVGTGTGGAFLRDLRREVFLADIPVIFILDNEDFRQIDLMRDLGVKHYLVKPYHRTALLDLLSRRLNAQVEMGWRDLSAPQRKALDETLTAFNMMADDIANGNPLPFDEINDACTTLVEVVARNDRGFLLSKIKDHDNFTFVHSLRYSALMALFGKAIGLPKDLQVQVASGGLLHDIGMLSIPRGLLHKSGRLSSSEIEVIQGHVGLGERLLSATGAIPKGVSTIVTQHHEMMDGSGYPRGLKGGALNELAQMAAIIDVFCALTDRRPYRRTMAPHAALEMMATQMKRQLNIELLMRFREILLDMAMAVEPADEPLAL